MNKLSKEKYLIAKNFLSNNARSLERSIFQHEFELGNVDEIINNFKRFQNEDGGFGNALEPDVRYSSSSVLATMIALQYLSKIKSNEKISLIEGSLAYLKSAFKMEEFGWENVPVDVVTAPRAIWWEYYGVHQQWGNPNAEALGYFYEYQSIVHLEYKELLLERAVGYLNSVQELEMHEILCYIRLSERLPVELNQQIVDKLDYFVEKSVVKDPKERNGYCLVPLQVVHSPSSRFYPIFADIIPYDLDKLIESQQEDGSWIPNWSWGRFEDEWKKAKLEWQGYLTFNNLRILRNFDRIE
jgi:hypothetical protein